MGSVSTTSAVLGVPTQWVEPAAEIMAGSADRGERVRLHKRYHAGCRCATCEGMRVAWQQMKAINDKRVAAGVCRHCGSRLPCWNEQGDSAPGVKHTAKTLRQARAWMLAEATTEIGE